MAHHDGRYELLLVFAMQLLTRRNVFSGKRYSEDPAIFAWNIFNEPRNPQDQEVPGGQSYLQLLLMTQCVSCTGCT
jgi:hypothetical protein